MSITERIIIINKIKKTEKQIKTATDNAKSTRALSRKKKELLEQWYQENELSPQEWEGINIYGLFNTTE